MTKDAKLGVLRRCCALLVFAILLRVVIAYGPMLLRKAITIASTPAYYSFLYYLNTGQVLRLTDFSVPANDPDSVQLRFRDVTAKTEVPQPKPEQTEPAKSIEIIEPEERVRSFAPEDADKILVTGTCTLSYDKAALLCSAMPDVTLSNGPVVLIVHTHTCESYTPEPGWDYEQSDPYRTLDPAYSVVRVGSVIAEALEANGIPVIHDTTINDHPSYNGAYGRMETIISDYLAKYPSIQMVLDVHRDAFELADGTFGGTAVDGTAQVMLVVGTNENGLYHPNWQGNLSFALKLEVLMNRADENLSKGIRLCPQRYNAHLTPLSMLVEFGAAGDTLQEALNAADAFSEVLSELLLASAK